MHSYETTKNELTQSAKLNHVCSIRLFNQYTLIAKHTSSFFTKFFSPSKLSLDSRGICYGLVSEWYWHLLTKKDLLSVLQETKSDELIRNIGFVQNHHMELCKDLLCEDQPFDRGDRQKMYGLTPVYLGCQENWLDKNIPQTQYCLTTDGYEERREFPANRHHFFGKCKFDFRKVIDETIDENNPGALREIFLISAKKTNHFMGFTCQLDNEGKKKFIVFDPNFGEFTFSALKNCKEFLCNAVKIFYRSIDASNDHFARVDVTIFKQQKSRHVKIREKPSL